MKRDVLMAQPEWRLLIETLPELLDLLSASDDAKGMYNLLDAVWGYLGDMVHHWDQGSPVVWYNLGFNCELLAGFGEDIGRVCIESQAVLQNIIGDPELCHAMIDLAESKGMPPDLCSADKSAVGAIRRGLYPEPVCCVGINTPCDAQVVSTQAMAELADKPFFIIDVPYWDDERAIAHVARQIGELIVFLEKHLGRKLDWDRMAQACGYSNRTAEAMWEWLDWRRQVPLAQSSKLVGFGLILHLLVMGTPRGERLARALAEDARDLYRGGGPPFEEQVRAIWYQDSVWTDIQIYDWMERELGLTVPIDIFGYYANEGLIDTSSEEAILGGLARKLVKCQPMARQFRGNIEMYISDFLHLHEAYSADCGIFAGHVACKHAWGGIGLFREACRDRDIPLLVFEFDMFDARITPREAIQAELRRFVEEVVLPRKQATTGRKRRMRSRKERSA